MRPNAWVGLVAMIVGAGYALQAAALPKAPIGNPMAPLYFPIGLGVLMALLGAMTFFFEWRKGLNSDDKAKRPKLQYKNMKLILYVIVLCLIYTAIFDHAGFVFSTLPFLMAMLLVINAGKAKLIQNVIISVIFTFGMWYIFVHIFQISLPSSPLGFI